MPDQRSAALKYAYEHKTEFLEAFKELLRIPSNSNDRENDPDIKRAAEWLAAELRALGMQKVQVFPTAQHPIVYGEWLGAPGAPTVLIYGHYDVQPVDPLDLWKTSPFEPTIIGDNIFARGSSDMKGQALVTLKAVESLIKTGGLPVNIKWLLEGEEEIGSPSLGDFLVKNKEMLASDLAVNPDSGMMGAGYPTITDALRGIAYFEVRIHGSRQDLHSGMYGGLVHNPAVVLAELIAGMHDNQGRVTLPGFYDRVRPLSKQDREELARLPIGEQQYLERTGVPALYGEAGYTPNERVGARPTLEVNGLLSGYTGEGSKTVLPAWAMAKVSMRLVPDQTPDETKKQLIQYLEEKMPKDVRWEIKEYASGMPSISSRDNPGIRAMTEALETVWGVRPYFHREGGSIPVVADMQSILGIESVIAGFSLPDDGAHAPNEKLNLSNWYKGIDSYIHFFLNLRKVTSQ